MLLEDIIDALQGAPLILNQLVRALPDEALGAGHDADNWSIKEVVLHLRDTEEVMLERYTKVARENAPFLAAYDQEAYARDRKYQDANVSEGLAGFAATRRQASDLFRGLTDADLDRTGVHEERGTVTLGGLVEHIIVHDVVHLAQISRALAAHPG